MAGHHKAKPADQGAGVVPENLYHTTLTVIDHHATTCGATTCLQVLGTHTTLDDARAFAYHDALRSLNYQPYDFSIYATRENFGMPPQKKGQLPTAGAVAAAVAAAAAPAPKPTTAAAKLAAEHFANESGYSTSTGTSDTENDGSPEVWPYGDEVLVYAKARAGGQEFLIGVVEKPNTEHLASAGPMYGNVPLLPHTTTSPTRFQSKFQAKQPLGAIAKTDEEEEEEDAELSYVIQTKTDYSQSEPEAMSEPEPEPAMPEPHITARHPPRRRRSSSITRLFQACEIEACFPHKRDAVEFARRWLESQKESGMFVQYDEREQLPRSFFLPAAAEEEEEEEDTQQQWPFGEDVLVHAVASTGENYCVAVRTVKGAQERFGKKKKKTTTRVPRRGRGGGRDMDVDVDVDVDVEVARELVREEGMEEGMKGREERWMRSYYEDSARIET